MAISLCVVMIWTLFVRMGVDMYMNESLLFLLSGLPLFFVVAYCKIYFVVLIFRILFLLICVIADKTVNSLSFGYIMNRNHLVGHLSGVMHLLLCCCIH